MGLKPVPGAGLLLKTVRAETKVTLLNKTHAPFITTNQL